MVNQVSNNPSSLPQQGNSQSSERSQTPPVLLGEKFLKLCEKLAADSLHFANEKRKNYPFYLSSPLGIYLGVFIYENEALVNGKLAELQRMKQYDVHGTDTPPPPTTSIQWLAHFNKMKQEYTDLVKGLEEQIKFLGNPENRTIPLIADYTLKQIAQDYEQQSAKYKRLAQIQKIAIVLERLELKKADQPLNNSILTSKIEFSPKIDKAFLEMILSLSPKDQIPETVECLVETTDLDAWKKLGYETDVLITYDDNTSCVGTSIPTDKFVEISGLPFINCLELNRAHQYTTF